MCSFQVLSAVASSGCSAKGTGRGGVGGGHLEVFLGVAQQVCLHSAGTQSRGPHLEEESRSGSCLLPTRERLLTTQASILWVSFLSSLTGPFLIFLMSTLTKFYPKGKDHQDQGFRR